MSRIVCSSKYLLTLCCYYSKINWNDRLSSTHSQFPACLVSVNGTELRIEKPTPFSPQWFSHKFRGPCVQYEIEISITNSKILWFNGPFSCGAWPDLSMFNLKVCLSLYSSESVNSDWGYRHARRIMPTDIFPHVRLFHGHISARHETCNERFKRFSIIRRMFRHNVQLRGRVFHAVSKMILLYISYEKPHFQINEWLKHKLL